MLGVTLYVCNITTQIKSNQEVNTEKLSLEYLNFQNIDECKKVNVTLIFQPSSKITTIGGYNHEYSFIINSNTKDLRSDWKTQD